MKPAVLSLKDNPWLRRACRTAIAGIGLVAVGLSPVQAGGYHHHRHNDWGGAAAAGVIGLAAGAIVGSALSSPGYYGGPAYYNGPIYYDPPPYRYLPPPPYPYRSGAYVVPPRYYRPGYYRPGYYRPPVYRPVQWSPEWIAYCARKYKSFNPRTGTYRTYSGRIRMCR